MKKFIIIVFLALCPSMVCAQMDIIGYINTQAPVSGWTNAQKTAFLNDLCSTHGYQETINGIPNPETKKDFANRMIREQIIRWVHGWRKAQAVAAVTYDQIELETP